MKPSLPVHVKSRLDNRYKWIMHKDDVPCTGISLGKLDGTWAKIPN